MPKFVIGGLTSDDLYEGELGYPWFVTACMRLSEESKLFQKVRLIESEEVC